MIDLNTMSKAELVKLKGDVEKALKSLDTRRKAEALRAAESAIKEFGYSLDDLVAEGGRGTKGVAKYANPADPTQTWTGRGRKPNWVIAWIEEGKSVEDLEL